MTHRAIHSCNDGDDAEMVTCCERVLEGAACRRDVQQSGSLDVRREGTPWKFAFLLRTGQAWADKTALVA